MLLAKSEVHGVFSMACFCCPPLLPAATVQVEGNIATATQQSALLSCKDVDLKKDSWDDIVVGEWLTTKAKKNGQMMKSASNICGPDAMSCGTVFLHLLCSSLRLTGYHSKPKAE